jgi:hypothetical protein
MKSKNVIPAQIFLISAIASLFAIHIFMHIGLIISLVVVIVGFWVYFELGIVFEHLLNVIFGCKNVKIKTEAIFVMFSSEPDTSKLTNERLRTRIYLGNAIYVFPALAAIISAAIFRMPPLYLLAALYIEIALYSLFFSDVNIIQTQTLIELKNDPDYTAKMKFFDKVSREIKDGKLCRDYPEGTFPEPRELKNQWDFFLGSYAVSYHSGKYEQGPEFEREAKRICERLISGINEDVPENLANILKNQYFELMIFCGDPPDKIKAYYETIKDKLTILGTDDEIAVCSKAQYLFTYMKLIERNEEEAKKAKNLLLETLPKLKIERFISEIKKNIARVEKLAETVTN